MCKCLYRELEYSRSSSSLCSKHHQLKRYLAATLRRPPLHGSYYVSPNASTFEIDRPVSRGSILSLRLRRLIFQVGTRNEAIPGYRGARWIDPCLRIALSSVQTLGILRSNLVCCAYVFILVQLVKPILRNTPQPPSWTHHLPSKPMIWRAGIITEELLDDHLPFPPKLPLPSPSPTL